MRLFLILMGAALAAGSTAAPLPPPPAGSQPLEVRHEVAPVFPVQLLVRGVTEGYLEVAVGVGADGKIEDCLPLAYSDSGFVSPTLACLREWTFEAAQVDGLPVPSMTQVTFHFVDRGLVLMNVRGEEIVSLINNLRWPRVSVAFRTYDLKDLDAIPRPIETIAPAYPAGLAQAGHAGRLTVRFFIDPTGAVRLPSVDPGADQRLAPFAIAAVQRWRFDPPLRHRRPAQVLVSQVFQFNAPKG